MLLIVSFHIKVVNNGPSPVGVTVVKSYWPMRIESGDVLVNISAVTMDTGGACSVTTVINSEEHNDVNSD